MNNLSWMIYLADVAGSVEGVLYATLILGSLCFTALGITGLAFRGDRDEDYHAVGKAIHARLLRLWWVPLVLAALFIVTPSSNTIYAIAASEMGEDVLNSETGGKAVKALDAWLDRQIDGEK